MGGDQNQEPIIVAAKSTEEQQQQQFQHAAIVDPTSTTTTYLLHHAPSPCTTTTTPFYCCCCSNNSNSNTSSMKRRSPPPQPPSSATTSTEEHRACKKLNFREQQQQQDVLCDQYANTVAAPAAATSYNFNTPLSHHSFKGFLCDPSPTPTPTPTPSPSPDHNKGVILTKAEPSNSMRLRRMKDCLREMRKCWDEAMMEEEEEEIYDEPEGVEGDKELSKDECGGGGDAEEAVRVEWVDKCLSICFKCPCNKGYQILLSGNNCYYKLV